MKTVLRFIPIFLIFFSCQSKTVEFRISTGEIKHIASLQKVESFIQKYSQGPQNESTDELVNLSTEALLNATEVIFVHFEPEEEEEEECHCCRGNKCHVSSCCVSYKIEEGDVIFSPVPLTDFAILTKDGTKVGAINPEKGRKFEKGFLYPFDKLQEYSDGAHFFEFKEGGSEEVFRARIEAFK